MDIHSLSMSATLQAPSQYSHSARGSSASTTIRPHCSPRMDTTHLALTQRAAMQQPATVGVSQSALQKFFDTTVPAQRLPLSQQTSQLAEPELEGWNNSVGVDWRALNGSRDIPLLLSDLVNINDAEITARTLDKRTGHRLDWKLPMKARFVHDAYYARILQQRISECNVPPHKRPPAAYVFNGQIREAEEAPEQRQYGEERRKQKHARMQSMLAIHVQALDVEC